MRNSDTALLLTSGADVLVLLLAVVRTRVEIGTMAILAASAVGSWPLAALATLRPSLVRRPPWITCRLAVVVL